MSARCVTSSVDSEEEEEESGQSYSQPASQPASQSTDQPASQSTDQPVYLPVNWDHCRHMVYTSPQEEQEEGLHRWCNGHHSGADGGVREAGEKSGWHWAGGNQPPESVAQLDGDRDGQHPWWPLEWFPQGQLRVAHQVYGAVQGSLTAAGFRTQNPRTCTHIPGEAGTSQGGAQGG